MAKRKQLKLSESLPIPVAEVLASKQVSVSEAAAFIIETFSEIREAYTQADIELALDDRGWLVGGKKMAGELDPLSRTVQVNKSRYYWLRDPLARASVRIWTDYGLGATAISYNCEDDAVQTKLDKFMKDRRNRKLLNATGIKRLSTRLLVDGEIFFAIFEDGTIRKFDPLQMNDIICDPDDEDTVYGYKRVTASNKVLYYKDWTVSSDTDLSKAVDPVDKKKITEWEDKVVMYHLPFDAFEQRGTGLLCACVNWSREHRRFMEARVAIVQSLATYASKISVKGGQAAVNKVRDAVQSTFAVTGLQAGTERNPQPAPAAAWIQNEGVDLTPMPRSTGASDAKSDGDQLKLMVSAGTGIALHYYGDNSTGNLATSTAMELPMLKMFEGYQKLWVDAFRDIFSIVLQEKPDEEGADIEIDLPPILADDLGKLGTFLTSASAMFPELKVPAVLRMMLVSLGVPNVDEVMEEIEAKREEIEANTADLASKGIMAGPDGKAVIMTPPKDGAKPGDKTSNSGNSPGNVDQTEADRNLSYRALAIAIKELSEKL